MLHIIFNALRYVWYHLYSDWICLNHGLLDYTLSEPEARWTSTNCKDSDPRYCHVRFLSRLSIKCYY